MFFTRYGSAKFFVNLPVAGINAAITNHFIMFFRDMAYKTLYKFHNRDSFFHVFVILMTVVMKSDEVAIIFIDPGSGDDWTSEIAADIFYDSIRITSVWFCIDVKTIFMLLITEGFYLFKGWTDFAFHFIKQCGPESVAQIIIVEMIDIAPETVVTVATFRDETMDMWVPF